MKNVKLTKITALVLLVTMIALMMVSGTLAKYATEVDGTGTAIVAKWDVSLKVNGEAIDDSTEFNLFDASNVYDLDGLTAAQLADLSTVTDPTVDTDVAEGTTKAIVAPGTWGKVGFEVVIGNDTEVSVEYGINVTNITTNGIPLKFSTDGSNWVEAANISELAKETVTYSTIKAAGSDITKTATLYWKWDYSIDTATDTTLATATTLPECTITATFGATQAD